MVFDCFISYASADFAHAQALHKLLTNAGFSVWFDKVYLRDLDGAQWHREIGTACEDSRIVLPVLTPRWKNSDWTRFETYGAEAVIPILAEGTWDEVKTPPLARWQSHTVSQALEPERLVASIRTLLRQQAPEKRQRVANLRYRPTAYFVGREAELDQIHEILHGSPATLLTQGRVMVVTALGGIGKTTLARQYAEKFWRCYQEMYWVDCRLNLNGEFARIHDILRPAPEYASLKDGEKAAWALASLCRPDGALCLLILDNVENEEVVSGWIPKTGNCHTIITSRFTGWSPGIRTCPVWLLKPEPARDLLMRRSGCSDRVGADALAKKLDYLPLALEQAAAYIAEQESEFGFAGYLRLYQGFQSHLLGLSTRGSTQYPDPVFLTWRTTIDRLGPGPRSILRLTAFLASAPIPVEMLFKGCSLIEEEACEIGLKPEVEANEFVVRQWTTELRRYSLIQDVGQSSFSVHSLVQAVERHQVPLSLQPKLFERTVALIANWAPSPSHDFQNWPSWRVIEPHAQRLLQSVNDDKVPARLTPAFVNEIGLYLMMVRTDLTAAEPLLRQALLDRENSLGPEHSDTLESVNNLGFLCSQQGKYAEAESLYVRALQTREHLLGPSAADTLLSANNLAALYDDQGKYAEAETLYRRVFNEHHRKPRPDGEDTILSCNNLAYLLKNQGNYADAEPLYQRAMQISQRLLGPDHPTTLATISNLASLYSSMGKYSEAQPLCEGVLRSRERVLGTEHPDTLMSLNNLAHLYSDQRLFEKAELLYQRALRSIEQLFGPDHPQALTTASNLAGVYSAQGRYAQAEPLYTRVLQTRERKLGSAHPDTITSTINLAALHRSQRNYPEAEALSEKAARSSEEVLGSSHPTTLAAFASLADVYRSRERYSQAEVLYCRVLRERERLFGPLHDETLVSLNNLAALYSTQGKYKEAEILYWRAIKDSEGIDGVEHLNSLATVNNLAHMFEWQGKYAEAEPLYQRAALGMQRALGDQHPHAKLILENWERCRALLGPSRFSKKRPPTKVE